MSRSSRHFALPGLQTVIAAIFAAILPLSHLAAGGNGVIDVRDFGAVGDGKHDDTAAIQRALDAAAKVGRSARHRGVRYACGAAVYFPNGFYRITDTLKVHLADVLRGDGQAYLDMESKDKDILNFTQSWQTTITGLNFFGGRRQLDLGNPNMDRGMIVIDRCRFALSSGPAVDVRPNSNSTFLIITNCLFTSCRQAVISNCDKTSIRDCWISTDPEMKNCAAIVNMHGVMRIDGLLGVPLTGQPGQRWIDNHGVGLHCDNSRFGAEGGGFTPIYNFVKHAPEAGSVTAIDCGANTCGGVISLTNCEVNAQSNAEGLCAVYCMEIPNVIDIRNTSIRGVPPVKIAKSLDTKDYFANAIPGTLRYTVTGHGGDLELPELLKNPAAHIKKQPIPTQLTEAETKIKMQSILAALPAPAPARSGKYIPVTQKDWSLDAFMDATRDKNSEYLALGFGNGRTVLMKRTSDDKWPHAEIRMQGIDLDKFPFFEFDFTPDSREHSITIKAVDAKTEQSATVSTRAEATLTKHRIDLRKYGFTGKRDLILKVYYIGMRYEQPAGVGKKYVIHKSVPGAHWRIDFAGFTPERSDGR